MAIAPKPDSRIPPADSTDKWEVQLRKGCLELAILATLWDGKHYGLEILRRLERDSDVTIAEGTVYPLLRRLRAEGLLQSQWVEAEAGHPRKYYQLTPAGYGRVVAMARVWSRFSASLAELLEPISRKEQIYAGSE